MESTKETEAVECDGRHIWTVLDIRTDRMRSLAYSDILAEGIGNFRVPGGDGRWYRITRSEEVAKKPVRCIRVDTKDHLFRVGDNILTHNTGGGKSVLQRNVIFSIIAHSKDIKFLGIDLKRVELNNYGIFTDAVLGVATTLQDAVLVLEYAQKTMMSRYDMMSKLGYNDFKEVPNHGPAIMVMIDEAGQLLDSSGSKGSDEAKEEGALKGKAQSLIGSIARLGRAAHVHLAIATQRPDARMIPGELKENLMFRAGCGHLTSIASSMLFDDNTGMKTPPLPKGRAAIMTVGQKPEKLQVYFTPDYKWMIDWMSRHGLNVDGTPTASGSGSGGNNANMDRIAGDDVIEETLSIDNSADVDKAIRERQEDTVSAEAGRSLGPGIPVSVPSEEEPMPQAAQTDADGEGGLKRLRLNGESTEAKPDPSAEWDDVMDDIVADEQDVDDGDADGQDQDDASVDG